MDYGNARGEQYARMSDLRDYRVSEEDPDPRGWTVVDRQSDAIGTVDDLIVDTSAMKVRYLDVSVREGGAARNLRIPAEQADLDESRKRVILQLQRSELGRYTGAALGGTETARTGQRHADTGREMRSDADAARITRSEEELVVGKREVDAGEVVVNKSVETEHVRQPVARRVERVRIERRPISDATAASAAEIGPGEIRMPVSEEELVVEKRPVAKEEVIVSKDTDVQHDTVDTDLRKERVHVSGEEDVIEGDTRTTETSRNVRRGGHRG